MPSSTSHHANHSSTLNAAAHSNPVVVAEPDVSEWSGLLINEQEVAIHPVQAVDLCMASSANSIELTPLWPKSGSPGHCKGAWPADHKSSSKGGQRAPAPPPPAMGPPAVPTKSKHQPPPAPPPLPVTSSREFLQQRKQQELSNNHQNHHGGGGSGGHHQQRRLQQENGSSHGSSETKGPAPQPPTSNNAPPVTTQPLRPSSSVSRGLQVEEDDLIQFTNGQRVSLANGGAALAAGAVGTGVAASAALSTSASVAQLKKQLRSRLSLDDELDPEMEDEDDEEETASARTADEQMDYLEGLEACPCYAKCCLDSIISLFCVTVLG